jgi:hypothetical protein
MNLSQIERIARPLDATSFVTRMPDPVLIACELPAAPRDNERTIKLRRFGADRARQIADETAEELSPFFLDTAAVAEATPPSGIVRGADPSVIQVVKTERNVHREMITIGRSRNNDVVIDDKAVSKVHAYFVRTGFRWWLHDQPSTNGTFIDESEIDANGRPLAEGAKVSFGHRLTFRFFTARGLHEFVTGRR